MRLRRKPWARPELEAWEYFIQNPSELRGSWEKNFGKQNPIHLELGCGKGGFIAEIAAANPNINYIAIDLKSEVIVLAKRQVEEKANKDLPLNVRLMSFDIERIDKMLAPEDKIQRIYINFCNPWPKDRHKKHRLTYTRQLEIYKSFLTDGGDIWFKTDDTQLFEESIEYFKEANYNIAEITYDLHGSTLAPQVFTEHEKMFSDQGINIKFLRAIPIKSTANQD